MPKLPVVSGQQLIDASLRLGFTQAGQRGSHIVIQRESVGCVVPKRDQVKKGTLASIIPQAERTRDVFIEALNA